MRSLSELIKADALSFEEKTDLVLSLIEYIDMGYTIPVSSKAYAVTDNGNIAFLESDNECVFASPEFFSADGTSLRDRQWFTLGLVTYYIFYGKIYYEEKGISFADILSPHKILQDHLIDDGLFNGMLSALTSFDARRREEGIALFFSYLREKHISRLQVNYVCRGECVRADELNINGVLMKYPENDIIRGNNGKRYKVSRRLFIPFRLVPKKYTLEVEEIIFRDGSDDRRSSRSCLLFDVDQL